MMEFTFLPGMRIWYDQLTNPIVIREVIIEEEPEVEEVVEEVLPEEPEEEDEAITTFYADLAIDF